MTPEQLEKAVELNAKIKGLEDQLKSWTDAKRWYNRTAILSSGDGSVTAIDTKYLNLDAIRNLAMVSIEKELNELKQEFINL